MIDNAILRESRAFELRVAVDLTTCRALGNVLNGTYDPEILEVAQETLALAGMLTIRSRLVVTGSVDAEIKEAVRAILGDATLRVDGGAEDERVTKIRLIPEVTVAFRPLVMPEWKLARLLELVADDDFRRALEAILTSDLELRERWGPVRERAGNLLGDVVIAEDGRVLVGDRREGGRPVPVDTGDPRHRAAIGILADLKIAAASAFLAGILRG